MCGCGVLLSRARGALVLAPASGGGKTPGSADNICGSVALTHLLLAAEVVKKLHSFGVRHDRYE
jgi:hypothetical protein